MIRKVEIAVKTLAGVRGTLSQTQRANVAVETASGESHRKKMFIAKPYTNLLNQFRSKCRASSIFFVNLSSQACQKGNKVR